MMPLLIGPCLLVDHNIEFCELGKEKENRIKLIEKWLFLNLERLLKNARYYLNHF